VLAVLLTVAVSLTLLQFVGTRAVFYRWFGTGEADPWWSLKSWAWWAGWRVFGYVGLPALVVMCLPGERLRDYHVSPRGFVRHLWIYAVMFALILPAVYLASRSDAFRHMYPFYRLANRSVADLVIWELLYAAQFIALELFFRGFMLHGLRRSFGANAIFVMMVPYCMIHFGKPMAEAVGAIGAGFILGTLAMRTRSIWGGAAIHIAVAVTMDVLAMGSLSNRERS
jgi:membrane protease YdiL (CAAX protease family)